jgi:hypothetical protein
MKHLQHFKKETKAIRILGPVNLYNKTEREIRTFFNLKKFCVQKCTQEKLSRYSQLRRSDCINRKA